MENLIEGKTVVGVLEIDKSGRKPVITDDVEWNGTFYGFDQVGLGINGIKAGVRVLYMHDENDWRVKVVPLDRVRFFEDHDAFRAYLGIDNLRSV